MTSSGDEENYYDAAEDTESDDDETVPKPSGESKHAVPGPHGHRGTTRKHAVESGGTRIHSKLCKKRKRRALRARQPVVVNLPQAGETLPVEIVFTQSVVDVIWQVLEKFLFSIFLEFVKGWIMLMLIQ